MDNIKYKTSLNKKYRNDNGIIDAKVIDDIILIKEFIGIISCSLQLRNFLLK